jgi:hypothetical protein
MEIFGFQIGDTTQESAIAEIEKILCGIKVRFPNNRMSNQHIGIIQAVYQQPSETYRGAKFLRENETPRSALLEPKLLCCVGFEERYMIIVEYKDLVPVIPFSAKIGNLLASLVSELTTRGAVGRGSVIIQS